MEGPQKVGTSSGMRFMNVPTAKIAVDAPVLLREREKDIAILVLN
jgi:hypothetical protein